MIAPQKPDGIIATLRVFGWIAVVGSGIVALYLGFVAGSGAGLSSWFSVAGGLVSGLVLVALSAIVEGIAEVSVVAGHIRAALEEDAADNSK